MLSDRPPSLLLYRFWKNQNRLGNFIRLTDNELSCVGDRDRKVQGRCVGRLCFLERDAKGIGLLVMATPDTRTHYSHRLPLHLQGDLPHFGHFLTGITSFPS